MGSLLRHRRVYVPVLSAAVCLVILGVGLSVWAGSGANDSHHSGDLAYLQIEAEAADRIEYVILHQPGMTCDAGVFGSGSIEAIAGRIDVSIVNDPATVGLCVRADYGYGNYLYKKYGDDRSFIRLIPADESDNAESPDRSNWPASHDRWRISIGPGLVSKNRPSIDTAEFIVLGYRDTTCAASAFEGKEPTIVANNQLIDLTYGVPQAADPSASALCFRADYGDGNYLYAGHGIDSGIILSGGRQKGFQLDEIVFADLTASALAADRLQYVVFQLSWQIVPCRIFCY